VGDEDACDVDDVQDDERNDVDDDVAVADG